MTTSKPAVVRYMAPELLDPSNAAIMRNDPPKESDIYSLAMTAYEILSDILPYGSGRESVIAFSIVSGERPLRPNNPTAKRWLPGPIWTAVQRCWDENLQSRPTLDLLRRAFVGLGPVPEQEPEREKEVSPVVPVIEDGPATTCIDSGAIPPPEAVRSDPSEKPQLEEKNLAQGAQPSTEPYIERPDPPLRPPSARRKKLKKKAMVIVRRVVGCV